MPASYKDFDVESYCLERCITSEQKKRVLDEMAAYRARDMLPLLQWTKHFVAICVENNIIWGVGRGSSVASFVLFLLGVHQVDSVKYNLDWQEFLR
jgi:DNA polymerase-3 subunit alpha